jgi:hypothetical protein
MLQRRRPETKPAAALHLELVVREIGVSVRL